MVEWMNMPATYVKTPVSADRLFVACISIYPLFLLSIARWIHGLLFMISAISVYIIVKAGIHRVRIIPEDIPRRWLLLVVMVLASPIFAVFVGQCFRQAFAWRDYDSPARFLLCIPILLALVHCRVNAVRALNYSITGALVPALVSIVVHPATTWEPHRITTYFVDPLTFGSLSLTLGLLSLVLIDEPGREPLSIRAYKVLGFAIGVYLSILSGSRTGWLALPLVIFVWLLFKDQKRRFITVAVAIGTPCVLSLAAYYHFPVVQQKVAQAANEFFAYHWNELNPDNSIAMRISFYRMAFSLFAQHPFGGWGDTGFSHVINTPEFARYATQYTREFVLKNGFHNEMMTNMVRSGVWGLLSSASLFLFPTLFSIRGLRSKSTPIRRIALLSCSYFICTFISGMSTEVFNLKFTASFHALMITCLTGSLLLAMRSTTAPDSICKSERESCDR